jgi:small subunit ribosomal protein S1
MDHHEALVKQEALPETNQNSEEPVSEKDHDMGSLLEQEGFSLELPKEGEIRSGVVARIGPGEILVSIGTKSEGIITGREKETIPPEELEELQVGQEILVYVLDPEDQNGNVVLSYTRAREEHDWLKVEQLLESGEAHEAKVIGYNKGGLIVPVGSLRGFVPASQISVLRKVDSGAETPEQRWGKMVGDPIKVRVIEVDRERRRLILSERAALQETRETLKDRLLDELEEGSVRAGRVTSLADFGAFVNIDGADGLVHLSEITWDRIQHPNEVLKVGQEVKVRVISMDRDRKRIGLSIRQLLPDPWMVKVEGLKEGLLVEGTITHLTKFGAFARIGEELEGLIHVSELSEHRVNHPKEVVKEGDVVTMRIIKIDPERRRIGLSLRKVDSPAYADLDWKMALSEEIGDVKAAHTEEGGEAPEAEALEAEASEVEASEVEAPEAEAPEAEAEDTEVQEPEAAEQEVEETASAEVETTEAAPEENQVQEPTAAVSEVEEAQDTEVQEPEAEEPEAEEPEAQEPETQEPETQEPEAQEPETQEPETQEPEAQEPETQEPETQEPEAEEEIQGKAE